MTTQQQATTSSAPDEDGVRRAVADLITVFENLGPEHQALRAEEAKTAARERRGTLVRMGDSICQVVRNVSLTIERLATVHGLRDIGVTFQFSKAADGTEYTHLPTLASSDQTLQDALIYLEQAATTLDKAYTPTKKHPGLAMARCPEHVAAALSSLRSALHAVAAELSKEDEGVAEEFAPTLTLLEVLEKRVCRTVPIQGVGPSAEEVVAAIQANPEVARAAAKALAANA
ncbi:hypothetical protein LRE75_33240 [Streptomyces sp. 372A]